MKCMYCGCIESKVIDSRSTDENTMIRRRRECVKCGRRFTTYETIETTPVLVIKAGGNREAFDPNKIKNGIIKACEKRPVPMFKIDKLVEDVQKQVYNSLDQEISSKEIGAQASKNCDNFLLKFSSFANSKYLWRGSLYNGNK